MSTNPRDNETAIREFASRISGDYDPEVWPINDWARDFADWALPRFRAITDRGFHWTDTGVRSLDGLVGELDLVRDLSDSAQSYWPDPYPQDNFGGIQTIAEINTSEAYSIVASRAVSIVFEWIVNDAYAARTEDQIRDDSIHLADLRNWLDETDRLLVLEYSDIAEETA